MADTRRVLVIDDSIVAGRVVDALLRNCGFEQIEVVHDGKTALDRMQASVFDIVICDWEMDPISGIDVLQEVRRNPNTKHTHFILMSAKKDPRWILAAKKAGADCLIAKPFDADMLKTKIAQLGRRD